MKELNWKEHSESMQWDAWRRPHVQLDSKFTLFDTGEIVGCTRWTSAGDRGYYGSVGIDICNSAEIYETIPSMAKLVTPDGRKVAKAHLMLMNNGSTDQQLLAVDELKKEVYFCGQTNVLTKLPNVSEDISRRATLYWARHDCRPVSNPIRLVTPYKLDEQQKQRKQECELLIQAKAALAGTNARISNDERIEIPRLVYDTDTPLIDIVANMKDDTAAFIARHGGIPTKKTEYVPYLKF